MKTRRSKREAFLKVAEQRRLWNQLHPYQLEALFDRIPCADKPWQRGLKTPRPSAELYQDVIMQLIMNGELEPWEIPLWLYSDDPLTTLKTLELVYHELGRL